MDVTNAKTLSQLSCRFEFEIEIFEKALRIEIKYNLIFFQIYVPWCKPICTTAHRLPVSKSANPWNGLENLRTHMQNLILCRAVVVLLKSQLFWELLWFIRLANFKNACASLNSNGRPNTCRKLRKAMSSQYAINLARSWQLHTKSNPHVKPERGRKQNPHAEMNSLWDLVETVGTTVRCGQWVTRLVLHGASEQSGIFFKKSWSMTGLFIQNPGWRITKQSLCSKSEDTTVRKHSGAEEITANTRTSPYKPETAAAEFLLTEKIFQSGLQIQDFGKELLSFKLKFLTKI